MSTYKIDVNATEVQTGESKNVIQAIRFEENCKDKVTPVDDGRRDIMLPRRSAAN